MGVIQKIDQITTEWDIVRDPGEFVCRYVSAIQSYFEALLKNPHDAEEVSQEFMLRVVQVGFVRVKPELGRFRDYLKTAVRNAALNYQQRRRSPARNNADMTHVAAPSSPLAADAEWLASWRRCLLSRAWRALAKHERRRPEGLPFTVLRLKAQHANEDSMSLAARTAKVSGRPVRVDAFRKQVSRARRLFASLLVKEVSQTLDGATPARVAEELQAIDLMKYVRDLLPGTWNVKENPQKENPQPEE
jgi:Sigma-70 region 2